MITNSKGNSWTATGANLRTAYYDLNGTGGTVYVPPGTFYMVKQILLTNKTCIQGSGMGVTIIKIGSGFSAGVNDLFLARVSGGATDSFNNITIRDLTINGNGTTTGLLYNVGIKDFVFQNIEMTNSAGNGIAVNKGSGAKRGLITNCRAIGFTSATLQPFDLTNLENSVISNCIVTVSGIWGFDFHCLKNCTISNIQVHKGAYGVKFFGDTGEWGGNNTVSNVVIEGCTGASGSSMWITREYNSSFSNINIRGGVYTGLVLTTSAYITITGLYIDHKTTGDKCIQTDSGTHHITISNGFARLPKASRTCLSLNNANNWTISNFEFYGAQNDQTINAVKNCVFSNCKFVFGTYGVALEESSFVKFIGCDFSYNSIDGFECGIGTVNTNYSVVDCNFIANAGKGMDIEGDSNITILGCLFKDNAGDGIECNAVDSVMIKDCIMWGDPFDDNIVGSNNQTGTAYNIGMTII